MIVGIRADKCGKSDYSLFKPGEYGKRSDGMWYCCAPVKGLEWPLVCILTKYIVTENKDKTITVASTIEINRRDGMKWSGTLRDGIWKELK